MLGLLTLAGVSPLIALLCTSTSATPITYLPELIDGEQRLQPRGPPCSQEVPYGRGPNSSSLFQPDTAAGFSSFPLYTTSALSNLFVLGYNLVASNQAAIAQKATSSTLNWINMASYDASACATQCSNTVGCRSFDIYFQRSPTIAPSFDNSCPNPPSQCHIVCLLYNGIFAQADLVNTGETRGQFQVVIAGSNVFNKAGL